MGCAETPNAESKIATNILSFKSKDFLQDNPHCTKYKLTLPLPQ